MGTEIEASLLPPQERESIKMVLLGTFVAVCGAFEYGISVGYSSPTEDAIISDLGLSLSQYSVFGSILTIGGMVGAISSGRIADLLGRKGAMATSAAICIVGWIAIAFSKAAWVLDLGRLAGGFGVGVFSYVVPVYVAEIAPKDLRGGLTTANQLMVALGSSIAYLVGQFVTWRVLALVGIVPCIVQVIGLFFIPESPRWLAKVGRQADFESALRKLRGKDANISQEESEIKVGVGLMVFQQFGGANAIVFYASNIFVSAGFSSGKVGSIAVAIIQVPITLLGAILLDKSGRKPLLMVAAAGTCLGCLLAGTSFLFKAQHWATKAVPALNLTGILVFTAFYSLGMGAIPWVMMSEIFPINIKGIAGSLVTLVNWFGSWAVTYSYNYLESWSAAGTFYIYSAVSAVAIVFVLKLVPETRARTLEEIQSSMASLGIFS
ncbi:sugar transporter ERD6-like 16 isoform X2 [Nymphaea colorata]|uniref:sugar transporter ERD6-like 16 isoform X2 n=1 Tax=Nymphaea colorata TaxID=210225 RepID=UPI00129E84F0|nr:sugar transporter ERD6-like 16 isoform X2 [Nymphaea colorata]